MTKQEEYADKIIQQVEYIKELYETDREFDIPQDVQEAIDEYLDNMEEENNV